MIGNFENSREHLEAYKAIVSNDHIRSFLGLITMPIVINVEPLFLIRILLFSDSLPLPSWFRKLPCDSRN